LAGSILTWLIGAEHVSNRLLRTLLRRLLRLLGLDHSIDDQFGSHISDMMTAYNFLKLPPLPLHILQYEVAVLVFFPNSSAT
jgi:hypothetical protein